MQGPGCDACVTAELVPAHSRSAPSLETQPCAYFRANVRVFVTGPCTRAAHPKRSGAGGHHWQQLRRANRGSQQACRPAGPRHGPLPTPVCGACAHGRQPATHMQRCVHVCPGVRVRACESTLSLPRAHAVDCTARAKEPKYEGPPPLLCQGLHSCHKLPACTHHAVLCTADGVAG